MNEKWFKVSHITGDIIIFGENYEKYYSIPRDSDIKKHNYFQPLTIEKILHEDLGYTLEKEYKSFVEVLVDHPELINL